MIDHSWQDRNGTRRYETVNDDLLVSSRKIAGNRIGEKRLEASLLGEIVNRPLDLTRIDPNHSACVSAVLVSSDRFARGGGNELCSADNS